MSVELVAVSIENFDETLRLSVADDQLKFVATNAVSVAQSKFYPTLHTDTVYADGNAVGFVMYGFDPDEDRYYLVRLMIDQRYQGNGYGKSATEAVIRRLRDIKDCDAIYLSYVPANKGAAKLYRSIGFEETGETDKESGEIVMKYDL
jgi:diamine N-acetyltransferase